MLKRDEQAHLTCWKDIARYMGKGVRTVQRWEQQMALPIRRPNGAGFKGPVAASPAELDQWLRSHWSERRPHKSLRTEGDPGARTAHISLLKTSQQLRAQNHALIVELMTSLDQLRVTCARVAEQPLSLTVEANSTLLSSISEAADYTN